MQSVENQLLTAEDTGYPCNSWRSSLFSMRLTVDYLVIKPKLSLY